MVCVGGRGGGVYRRGRGCSRGVVEGRRREMDKEVENEEVNGLKK